MTRGFSRKFAEAAYLSARLGIRQRPTACPDCHGASPASAPPASGKLPPLKVTAARFASAVKLFADSEVGWKAKWMFGILLALLCAANGLTVANSYVGRNFMTAIAERHTAEFVRQAIFYVGVFAASTVVAVIARFLEERLGLLWRDNLTRRAVKLYLADGAYYHMASSGELANPDQRIADDARTFTASALSFFLMAFNSSLTIVAFSGVLVLISPLLSVVAVLYAAMGSYMTLLLGRHLVKLNYDQLDKEAGFRAALIHVRENAESILLARREDVQSARLLRRLERVITNFRAITTVNRNVGFFTTGYNWLIQIIPALIIAPAYIAGKVEFGVITQSAMAFSTAVAAFSLFVTQFQSLSAFAAVVARLNSMVDALDSEQSRTSAIQIVEQDGPLTYQGLTLSSRTNESRLVENLSITIPFGARVLVNGTNPDAGTALFKATAGIWTTGEGRIVRPRARDILFLAQKPYLPSGSIWQMLAPPEREGEVSRDRILDLLRELNLEQALSQAGGLDAHQNWETLTSLREQQLLAFLEIFLAAPKLVLMDRIHLTLTSNEVRQILGMLSKASIGYICNGANDRCVELFDAVLDCEEGGGWTWKIGEPARRGDDRRLANLASASGYAL
jgi:vitamin B12/bleomycin/antimicrobial peptide transport system ATP-binding/permease protein